MREHEVDAAGVDIKVSPRYFIDIAEHSMCQPGRPGPIGASHAGSGWFLPQSEVARVFLVVACSFGMRSRAPDQVALQVSIFESLP